MSGGVCNWAAQVLCPSGVVGRASSAEAQAVTRGFAAGSGAIVVDDAEVAPAATVAEDVAAVVPMDADTAEAAPVAVEEVPQPVAAAAASTAEVASGPEEVVAAGP
jgi:hypothetical protein